MLTYEELKRNESVKAYIEGRTDPLRHWALPSTALPMSARWRIPADIFFRLWGILKRKSSLLKLPHIFTI